LCSANGTSSACPENLLLSSIVHLFVVNFLVAWVAVVPLDEVQRHLLVFQNDFTKLHSEFTVLLFVNLVFRRVQLLQDGQTVRENDDAFAPYAAIM
jgi:hypothetical protein